MLGGSFKVLAEAQPHLQKKKSTWYSLKQWNIFTELELYRITIQPGYIILIIMRFSRFPDSFFRSSFEKLLGENALTLSPY